MGRSAAARRLDGLAFRKPAGKVQSATAQRTPRRCAQSRIDLLARTSDVADLRRPGRILPMYHRADAKQLPPLAAKLWLPSYACGATGVLVFRFSI
jgi:hypothetical protein